MTCGAKHQWTHINTMKQMCAHEKKKKPARHRPVAPILRASSHAIPGVICVLGHFWRSFFEASCLLEIDTAETSDGTVPPPAAELASASVPCATPSRHPSLSFAMVMFSASFIALTTSLSFHTFISSAAHSRPFVLCSSATTRRVGRVKVDGDGLRQFSG